MVGAWFVACLRSSRRRRKYYQENLYIPRVYKLSELKDGYNKDHKNPIPTVSCTHPHCRHTLTMVPPNYGFDMRGNITFKGFGHDEYQHQRGIS